jgi:PST family polysaccharide transporter
MGTDFYPRLVGEIGDVKASVTLVNEQTIASLLLAGPGVLATIAFAQFVVPLLYSPEFVDAISTLRWICIGMALRCVTWPPGFLIVAHNERRVFLLTEVVWLITHVGLAILLIPHVGLEGTGVAFAASYVVHGVVVYIVARIRYEYRPRRSTACLALGYIFAVGAAAAAPYVLSPRWSLLASTTIVAIVSFVSMLLVTKLVPPGSVPGVIGRLVRVARR